MLRLNLLLLLKVVEDVPFADDLEVWDHATLLEIWNRDHTDFVNLRNLRLVGQRPFYVCIPLILQEVLVVVDVPDLAGNCHAFRIIGSHGAIVPERL